jgi:CheY-like chemotaxis protein
LAALRRILIIDDHPRVLELMVAAFESHGDVTAAAESDAAHALDRIAQLSPDMVVLDIDMPMLDGVTLLRQIRAAGFAKPVIMCSGIENESTISSAWRAGCNGFVAKPATPEGWRAVARTILDYWWLCRLPAA